MERLYNYYFNKLSEAIANGYTSDFSVLPNGIVQCHSVPAKFYLSSEVDTQTVVCFSAGVALLLISTRDGEKGIASGNLDADQND